MEKKEKDQIGYLKEISEKLDKITLVLAITGKNSDTQIQILRDFGWEWNDIGKMVGLTSDAARMKYTRNNKKK